LFHILPLRFLLVTQASPIPAPMATTLRPMPQLPTTTPRPQPLESAWPMVAPNAQWPAPPLHLQPRYLRKLQRGMSCLTSPILSSTGDHLPTKTARSSSQKQQSQSTTQMAIQSSQAGKMRLVCGYGIFLSPLRLLTPRMQPVPQRLGRPSQLLLHFWRHHPGSRD
jgi:hypothetical protein